MNTKRKRMALALAALYDDNQAPDAVDLPSLLIDELQQDLKLKGQSITLPTRSKAVVKEKTGESMVKGSSYNSSGTNNSLISIDSDSDKEIKDEVKEDNFSATEPVIFTAKLKDTAPSLSLSKERPEELRKDVAYEWIGTSQYTKYSMELQLQGKLNQTIARRNLHESNRLRAPYNPVHYHALALVYSELGYSDVAVSNAHKAIMLIKVGYPGSNITLPTLPHLPKEVKNALKFHFVTESPTILKKNLHYLLLGSYQQLLKGLVECASWWDGLVMAKEARALYPKDWLLRRWEQDHMQGFKRRHEALKNEKCSYEQLLNATRSGKIAQKKYPWLKQKLFIRTPQAVRIFNNPFETRGCEIRSVAFGTPDDIEADVAQRKTVQEKKDMGHLGLFAKRDIQEREIILIDKTLLAVSNVPASRLHHCDACQSCLLPPYIHPNEIVKPKCCGAVAFCSRSCYDTATNPDTSGYHQVLCGKSVDWLYEDLKGMAGDNIQEQDLNASWKPIIFMRLAALVVMDLKKESQTSGREKHPLKHNLLSRMTANYGRVNDLKPAVYDWRYNTNVVAPTRALIEMGIDIFKTNHWDQEIIQTCYWRIENNVNMGTCSLFPEGEVPKVEGSPVTPKVNTINVHPNYLFFNHSCTPNVSWHSALPSPDVDLSWLADGEGGLLRPGNSAVSCIAVRNIKEGEELKISYVGDALGVEDGIEANSREHKRTCLNKWFIGGCGCEVCETENAANAAKEAQN